MNLPAGYVYAGPFIKQTTPDRIVYDEQYVNKPRTTEAMAFLRLGWLSAHISFEELRTFNVVDIGSGQGQTAAAFSRICANTANYDLSGPSISKAVLEETSWDLVILNDVLEHFDDIAALFDLKWRYAFLSFPETPKVATFEELTRWRHFRPNEHIYHLHETGVREWAAQLGAETINAGRFEDILRTRWDPAQPNITTMLLSRPAIKL
jgi:SAM-dependent methyltransferase